MRARDLLTRALDERQFLHLHPAPVLLVPPSTPARQGGSRLAVQTLLDLDHDRTGDTGLDLEAADVLFVVKSSRNPFTGMITLGRASNNDLILPTPTISKFHASFAPGPAGWRLTDRRAVNGTWVNGLRVEAGATVALGDDAWLRFGRDVLVRWVTAEALLRLMHGRAS